MRAWALYAIFGLLVYAPILYDTALFLRSEFDLKIANIEERDRYDVHQIFIPFGPVPEDWRRCSSTWNAWQVKRWDEKMCLQVIAEAMPSRRELLDYEGVMFTDVCRVAIMYVHGGVYADMDICAKRRTSFPKCEACLLKTSVGVSNDLMVAQKKHPVFANVLQQYADHAWINTWWYLPYIREMYATGPVRFTLAVAAYPDTQVITYDQIKIQHTHGNSWHSWDAIFFMHPWILPSALVLACAIARSRRKGVILGKNI